MEETKTKVGMEEITQAAEATYERLPEEEREEMEETETKVGMEEITQAAEATNERLPEEERKRMEETKTKVGMEEITQAAEATNERLPEEERKRMEETKTKVGMEEIAQAAEATYEKLPEEDKKEIKVMFGNMDTDKDGKISVEEFKTYFERKRDGAKGKSNLFNLIDRNFDGNLGLDEVLTLFYITESGRPVCDVCDKFIEALFFTCTYCHYSKPEEIGYNVCSACYKTGDLKHEHKEFLDNYTLFAEMKKKNGAGLAGVQTNSSFSSTGNVQQRERKRDAFKRRFVTFLQMVPGVSSLVGASMEEG
ncbi:hypothetical protein L6164_011903 [Bauhinia variegata]|uniref:Uncharacterized protein n=1 Tax=Bauhinia variegata TaxID=167791 RepID=A0ACB9P7S4_BAUVA|nr:hypothetical protein L6164_011903 [Bauhinia variegata]